MPASDDATFQRAKQAFLDGLAAYQAERFDDAERLFVASLDAVPGRISTLVNLAATRVQRRQPEAALATADQVIAAEPDNADAWLHRGMALGQLGRHADALASFDRLVALSPDAAGGWVRRGETLEHLHRNDDALAAFDRALALDDRLAGAWSRRGVVLRDLHRLTDAAESFRQAIAHGADDALHRYYLAAAIGETPPEPPRDYVERLFDGYAGDFDEHLVQVLKYRAPHVLAAPLAELHPARFRSALDLGCGTGLCGPLLRPRADALAGVDLSRQMLDKARALGVYDRLDHADIAEHLRATDATHDLVVAADVFIYVGDLEPVFAEVRRVLSHDGLFCFSVELPPGGDDAGQGTGYALQPSLRYAHSQRYLLALAERHDFQVRRLSGEPLREDRRAGIDGLFVHLGRR